ncbi:MULTISPECIES: hypothetical protein [Cysteiniphilum]|uniref:hypothetical protein n=1 Tax=Cysteiniphilum TaxID=2056696 RepID=UPI001784B26E|nr:MULTISPECIES: hypothetical protein [Cysteiniphilum]
MRKVISYEQPSGYCFGISNYFLQQAALHEGKLLFMNEQEVNDFITRVIKRLKRLNSSYLRMIQLTEAREDTLGFGERSSNLRQTISHSQHFTGGITRKRNEFSTALPVNGGGFWGRLTNSIELSTATSSIALYNYNPMKMYILSFNDNYGHTGHATAILSILLDSGIEKVYFFDPNQGVYDINNHRLFIDNQIQLQSANGTLNLNIAALLNNNQRDLIGIESALSTTKKVTAINVFLKQIEISSIQDVRWNNFDFMLGHLLEMLKIFEATTTTEVKQNKLKNYIGSIVSPIRPALAQLKQRYAAQQLSIAGERYMYTLLLHLIAYAIGARQEYKRLPTNSYSSLAYEMAYYAYRIGMSLKLLNKSHILPDNVDVGYVLEAAARLYKNANGLSHLDTLITCQKNQLLFKVRSL